MDRGVVVFGYVTVFVSLPCLLATTMLGFGSNDSLFDFISLSQNKLLKRQTPKEKLPLPN
jgi:hypothetical protein